MGLPGVQMWTWTLCAFLSWVSVGQALGGPQYMVAIPAVLESGSDVKFSASVLQTNETVTMVVTLRPRNITLFQQTTKDKFHKFVEFKTPIVDNEVVEVLEVEVRGDTFYSKEVKKVMFKAYKPRTFIQTDKPIYLPGQTVHFRVVTLDSKLRPANQLFDIIEIEDSRGNRIGQWLNTTTNALILQLSHSLNSEAAEGTYKVIVNIAGNHIRHNFKVEKYVLPKFEVKVNVLDDVSIEQEEIVAEVCAKYTYGQPVPGSVKLNLCRSLQRSVYNSRIVTTDHPEGVFGITPPCHSETKQTNKDGCASFTIAMSTFTKLDKKVLRDVLQLQVNAVEEGTEVSISQHKKIQISYVIGKLSFIDTPTVYDKGSNVEGKIKAVYFNNTPIPDMAVYLLEGDSWSSRLLQNLTTDSNGVAPFSFSTTNFKGNIQLQVSSTSTIQLYAYRTPSYETDDHVLNLLEAHSEDIKTISSIEVKSKDGPLPCGSDVNVAIKYTAVKEAQGSVDVVCLGLSRGVIVVQQIQTIELKDEPVNEGEVLFKFNVSPSMSPVVQVVAYAVLPSEAVIAHSAQFSVEKCFNHKVSVEFLPSKAVPGEKTTLQLTAEPFSLCGLSAVDQSIFIKEPGKILDSDKIFDLLPVKQVSHIPYETQDPVECLLVRPKRYVLPYPEGKDDVHTVLQNVGLKMATNLFIRVPSCLKYRGRDYYHGHGYGGPIAVAYDSVPQMTRLASAPGLGSAYQEDNSPIETIRTFFPETWIWDLVVTGEEGTKDIALTVPDTITTWETETFCLSQGGFGLAPRKEITVFQPFFLELTLPYSIIRGEHFELKATVFNYLPNCIMVNVAPTPSLDYTLTPLSGDLYTSCLCGNERKTLRWTMEPSALGVVNVSVTAEAVPSHTSCNNEIVSVPERGRIDVVTRPLIVKAEGTEMSKAYNWLLCPKGVTLTEKVNIEFPDNMIHGSGRATLSVLGDILGRALKNLDGLLRMPYGCGEQNMALLAPNIYILKYLKGTEQLTPAITNKAVPFLASGYQRQLRYKHSNGAYSTFGAGEENTWLTAFVLRAFAKAQSFIFIDPDTIQQTKTWLEGTQKENGCFEKSGKLFNNRMKGGVSDEVTLSAYITAAFLEMNVSASDAVVNRSLSCLKESMGDLSNTYTTALLAYVFTLAEDMETRAQLLQHLETVSIQEGGFLHWTQTAEETSASLAVEISSYVLLAKLSANPSLEDLGYAGRIVRWLTGQQNYYGGFSSTQDTVVALQALSLYSTLVFSPEGSSKVTVQPPSNQAVVFNVNKDNKLLYQEHSLSDLSGEYSLEVKGTACAAVQISVDYNIPTPTDVNTLSVDVKTEADCKSKRPKLNLKFKSKYTGEQNQTNMVILDIKMLSGFVPDPKSLTQLSRSLLVDRVEQKEDHVLVYIQSLVKDIHVFHNLDLLLEHQVQNLKPAVVSIYDYYQPSEQMETEYTSPCVAG